MSEEIKENEISSTSSDNSSQVASDTNNTNENDGNQEQAEEESVATVVATATKIETSLNISPDSLKLIEGDSAVIRVYTNASDFGYSILEGASLIKLRKLDKGLDVTAVKGGKVKFAIKATVDGGEEKSVELELDITALPVNPSLHKDKVCYPTIWPNLRGFAGDVIEIAFPDGENWDEVFVTSANRHIAYVDNNAKASEEEGEEKADSASDSKKIEVTLNEVGTTTLTVNLKKNGTEEVAEVVKEIRVPVWVEAVEKNQKIDYDKVAIRDYFQDNMLIEEGFKYGLKATTADEEEEGDEESSELIICELDEESEAGKQLKSHGLAKAKLEIEDLSQGTVYVKITVASDRGAVNKDTGGYAEPVDVVEIIPHRLVMGYLDKKDVIAIYNRFQALIREQFNR